MAAWDVFDAYVLTPFKSKENMKQLLVRIKEKVKSIFVPKKENTQAA